MTKHSILQTPTCKDCATGMGYKFNRPMRTSYEGRCSNCKQIKPLNNANDYVDTRRIR